MSLKATGTEQKVIVDQTQYFEANCTVKIFIQACFPRMLTKVVFWLIFKTKMLSMVQTRTTSLGTRAYHAFRLFYPF